MSMSAVPVASPHALLPLLPRFLRQRRRGAQQIVGAILTETQLTRPAFFMLLRVAQAPPEGASAEALRPGEPYATRDPHLPWLAEAVARDCLAINGASRYHLTTRGQMLAVRVEREATAYLAGLDPLPAVELARLADRLAGIAAGFDDLAAPHTHLARSRRVAALAPEASAAPLVRLERAVFDLWMARDDAHIAAWRAAWFPGPALDVLTHLWQGEVETLPALQTALADTQAPDDVVATLHELIEQGYVEWRGETLRPTRAGYRAREEIEAATDERYFGHWPDLDAWEIVWLRDTLQQVIDALPGAGG